MLNSKHAGVILFYYFFFNLTGNLTWERLLSSCLNSCPILGLLILAREKYEEATEKAISPRAYVANILWSFGTLRGWWQRDKHTHPGKARKISFWRGCYSALSRWGKRRTELSSEWKCPEAHIHSEGICWSDPGKSVENKRWGKKWNSGFRLYKMVPRVNTAWLGGTFNWLTELTPFLDAHTTVNS